MSEENKTLIEQVEATTSNEPQIEEDDKKDPLKEALEEQFKKMQTQSMLLGAQTMCSVILEKMAVWEKQPGKRTLNDHKRLIKEIKGFCLTGVSKKVNLDGTTSPIEEINDTDDSTKLTEEANGSN